MEWYLPAVFILYAAPHTFIISYSHRPVSLILVFDSEDNVSDIWCENDLDLSHFFVGCSVFLNSLLEGLWSWMKIFLITND